MPDKEITVGEFAALLLTLTDPEALPAVVGVKVIVKVVVWPALSVKPDETALVLKPPPVSVTPAIVTSAFPLFVSVTFNELLLPILVFPKLRLVGLVVRELVAATTVPLNPIESDEVEAVLVSETEPLTAPTETGERTTLNVILLPAPIVAGSVNPLMLKLAPETLAAEIVAVAVPLFVRTIGRELLLPMTTLPKLALDGLAEICGSVPVPPASIPVPLREIVSGELDAPLVTIKLPETAPTDCGAN
jgi:hypothetical protein